MAVWVSRWSYCSCCWSPVVSSGGRYPYVLYNFILGYRKQATVVFKADQKRLNHTPKKDIFVSSEQIHSLHVNFHTPKCSLTSPELLLLHQQQTCYQRLSVSHDKWVWSTVKPNGFTLVDLRLSADQNLWHFHVQRYSIKKMTTHFCQKQVEPGLNIPEYLYVTLSPDHQYTWEWILPQGAAE